MRTAVHLITILFIGALLVLVVTHAPGFATATTAVGGQITNDASLLAGYVPSGGAGYNPMSTNSGGQSG